RPARTWRSGRSPRCPARRSAPRRAGSPRAARRARVRARLPRRRGSSSDGKALFAPGSYRDDRHRHAGQLLDPTNVRLRLLRELLERPDVVDLLAPTVELLVRGDGAMEQRLVRREVVVLDAVRPIRGAYLERLEPGQHIELRQEDLGQAV